MNVGQIVSRSFRLYLRNFWRFLGMAIVIYLPLTAIGLPFILYRSTETIQNLSRWQSLVFEISQTLILGILGKFIVFLLAIALFRIISGHFLDSQITFWGAYKLNRSRFKALLMASVFFAAFFSLLNRLMDAVMLWSPTNIILITITTGFIWLILVLFGIFFAVTPQCIITTNLSAWQSMRQSKHLVDGGNVLRVFLLLILLEAISWGCGWVARWLDSVLLESYLQHVDTGLRVIISFRFTVVRVLLLPLSAVACSLLYYDLRARKEYSELGETKHNVKQTEAATGDNCDIVP